MDVSGQNTKQLEVNGTNHAERVTSPGPVTLSHGDDGDGRSAAGRLCHYRCEKALLGANCHSISHTWSRLQRLHAVPRTSG